MADGATIQIAANVSMWIIGGGLSATIILLGLYHGSVLRRLDERSRREEEDIKELKKSVARMGARFDNEIKSVYTELGKIKADWRTVRTCDDLRRNDKE